MKFAVLAGASLLALTACESVQGFAQADAGPTEKIRIVTKPEGASCATDRDNRTIDRIDNTPATAIYDKTGKDLTIRCIKSGYKEGKAVVKAHGNAYEDEVSITLAKKK